MSDPVAQLREANPVAEAPEFDWGAIERLLIAHEPPPVRHRKRGVLVAAGLCAALAGLFVAIAPWSSSDDLLSRAAAALAPGTGGVLYERWEQTGRNGAGARVTYGPDQLWIEAGAPQRYRLRYEPARSGPFPSGGVRLAATYGAVIGFGGYPEALDLLAAKLKGKALEIGGQVQERRRGEPTLTFIAPDQLWSLRLSAEGTPSLPGPHESIYPGFDPVGALRAALVEGRAHDAGPTELEGRKLERIVFDPQPLPADAPPLPPGVKLRQRPTYAYVEADSLRPFEIVAGSTVYRILAYEHLPLTRANLALADIRARHPEAKVAHLSASKAHELHGTVSELVRRFRARSERARDRAAARGAG
jgi:hypothetical protein